MFQLSRSAIKYKTVTKSIDLVTILYLFFVRRDLSHFIFLFVYPCPV